MILKDQSKVVKRKMSEELKETDPKPKVVRGEIKLSWKSAIAESWKLRAGRYIIQSVVILSFFGIYDIFYEGVESGLLRWFCLAAALLVINVGEDARLQRKASRTSYWIDPASRSDRNV
jgi:hypothetical protein